MENNDIFENFKETLFDSHMPVNIKWVSNKFHMDVNNAKKVMYEFAQKKKSKVKLNVFVSGELKSTKQSIMTVKQGLQFDAIDKYLKDTFSKVSSAHIQEILPLEQDLMETDPTNLYRKIEFVDNLQDKIQLQCAFAKMRDLTIEDYKKVKKEATSSSKIVPSKPTTSTVNTTPSKPIDKKTAVDKLFSKSKSGKETSKESEPKISIKEEKTISTVEHKVEKTKSPKKQIETPTKKTPEKKESHKQTEKKPDTKKRKRTTSKKDAGKGDIDFDEEDEEVDETPASPAVVKDESESEEELPKEKKPKKAITVSESPKNSINKYAKSPSKDKSKKTRRVKKVVEEQDAKGYYVSKEVWVEEEYSDDEDSDVKMEDSKREAPKKQDATSSKSSTTKKATSQSIMNFFKKK